MPEKFLERRTFLRIMSAGLGTGLVSFPNISHAFASSPEMTRLPDFQLGKPEWLLHEDGTFDILAGSIQILNCRPSINGQSIFAKNTYLGDSSRGRRIIYEMEKGYIILDLKKHSNTISIGTELNGLKNAPSWFNPLGEGFVVEANHFFKQSPGTGGQSGILEFRKPAPRSKVKNQEEEAWSIDSFMVSALIASNGDTLAVGAYEQSDFAQRSTIYSRPQQKNPYNRNSGKKVVFFETGFATEEIPLKEERLRLPDIFFHYGNQPFGTLQDLAKSIAKQNQARSDTDTNYFWTSYPSFQTSFSYKYLQEQLKAMDSIKPSLKIKAVVIGPGYCVPGDWLDNNASWPKTMEQVARDLFSRKYRAGIYVAPFVAHEKSRLFRNHPRWILKDENNDPIVMDYDADGALYALDGSVEDVRDYISKVFKKFHEIGFTYFEIDRLDWGIQEPVGHQKAKKIKTSVQLFRLVMDEIRDAVGPGSFISANRTIYAPVVGYVDSVRIGDDQPTKWNENITGHILNESYNTQYLNTIFWQNDPDIVWLNNAKHQYTADEQISLALWIGHMGGSIGTSDNFKLLDNQSLQLWRFIEPATRPLAAKLPFWGRNVKNKVAVRKFRKINAWSVLILNDTPNVVTETYLVYDLIGLLNAWIYIWEPDGSQRLGKSSQISMTLSSHESRLYYLADRNDAPTSDLNISGNDFAESTNAD